MATKSSVGGMSFTPDPTVFGGRPGPRLRLVSAFAVIYLTCYDRGRQRFIASPSMVCLNRTFSFNANKAAYRPNPRLMRQPSKVKHPHDMITAREFSEFCIFATILLFCFYSIF
jgi:hypothetical protein